MSETSEILAELKRVRAVLDGVNARLSKIEIGREFETRTVTFKQAAKMLSQGLTKTREMINAGLISTVDIGGRKMVTIAEIDRLTAPSTKVAATGRASQPKRRSSTSGADLKAWLKSEHKKKR